MICPKVRAVERERAARKWDMCQVVHLRRSLLRAQPGNPPLFGLVRNTFVFAAAQHIEHTLDKSMPADLRADIDLALNVPLVVHLQNPFLIPLTQVKVLAVEAQIGASE